MINDPKKDFSTNKNCNILSKMKPRNNLIFPPQVLSDEKAFSNVTKFWNDYLDTTPNLKYLQDLHVEANPAGNFFITDELIALYLKGKKYAGSSLVEDFVTAGDPLPKVGNYWIVLGSDQSPKLILKTKKIEINKFGKLPERIAIAEGEGDLSLSYWRQVHTALYSPYLEKWNVKDINEAHVITEFFEVAYK
jgi:uncharacterized protein YhfF